MCSIERRSQKKTNFHFFVICFHFLWLLYWLKIFVLISLSLISMFHGLFFLFGGNFCIMLEESS